MTYDLNIDAPIGFPITKQYVAAKLSERAGQPVAVRINSYGGDVQTALDIRQQFLDHDGEVTAYIYGMTASAATILATGADRVVMSRYALLLIHRCSGGVLTGGWFNEEELRAEISRLSDTAASLETLDRVVASLYALRSGLEPERVAEVMRRGAWLTAEESLTLGLVDEIVEDGEASAPMTDAEAEHFAACGLPLPPSGVLAGVSPAAHDRSWPQEPRMRELREAWREYNKSYFSRPEEETPDNPTPQDEASHMNQHTSTPTTATASAPSAELEAEIRAAQPAAPAEAAASEPAAEAAAPADVTALMEAMQQRIDALTAVVDGISATVKRLAQTDGATDSTAMPTADVDTDDNDGSDLAPSMSAGAIYERFRGSL